MKGQAIYKVPGGKMLRLSAEFEGSKVKAVSIRGDFFIHPEEGVEAIEAAIVGKDLGKELEAKIGKAAKEAGVEMYGVDAKSILEALKIAKEAAK